MYGFEIRVSIIIASASSVIFISHHPQFYFLQKIITQLNSFFIKQRNTFNNKVKNSYRKFKK